MPVSLKMVATEILMCGLKQIPMIGTAIEVVEGVQKRHEVLAFKNRIDQIERQLTTFDRKLRDLVQGEIQGTLQGLLRPDLDAPAFTAYIKNLVDIKSHGWSPALFQGLLQQTVHWDELCKNPSHYGTVLNDHESVDPSKLHVIIDADKTRILELTPFALHALLSRQRDNFPGAKLIGGADVWALPEQAAQKNRLATEDESIEQERRRQVRKGRTIEAKLGDLGPCSLRSDEGIIQVPGRGLWCPHCQQKLGVPLTWGGQTMLCPLCSGMFALPKHIG